MVSTKTCIAIAIISFFLGSFAFSAFNPLLAFSGERVCMLSHVQNATTPAAVKLVYDSCRHIN